MTTMLLALNATTENGQFLGDQLVCLKLANLFVQNYCPDRVIMSMSPRNELHTYWKKFLDENKVDVVYDTFDPGDWPTRWEHWDKWRRERSIEGRKFDIYRELTRRIDGANRQRSLCGGENGLNRKNIWQYIYHGQEGFDIGCDSVPIIGEDAFASDMIYWTRGKPERSVYIAPYAKCQANEVFTMHSDGFWPRVVHRVIDAGVKVTVGYNGAFCEELNGHPLYTKFYANNFDTLRDELCRHRLVACGNTGIGWLAAACGIPLLAMQHIGSVMADYHYEKCGVLSLVNAPDNWRDISEKDMADVRFPVVGGIRRELIREPDPDYVASRIVEEVTRVTVATTGCYDVLHAGHVRHLEESRSLGTRLVVYLNSDASVKRRKGDDRPVNNQADRETVLRSLRCVDDVRVFGNDTAETEYADLRPDVITNGVGYQLEDVVGKSLVESYGGRAVVTCRGEHPTTPLSTTRTLARSTRYVDAFRVSRDAEQFSINPLPKLRLLAETFASVAGLPGSVADIGAYRGACSYIVRQMAPYKRLHVFDTWDGNPHDDDLCHHKKGEWKASLAECKNIVGESPQTTYHEGVFPETAASLNGEMFSFVVVDGDTYQTTRDAIEFFWPRMVSGGKMILDDYLWSACSGVEKAVNEKFGDGERVVYPELWTCVVVKP